MKRSPDNRKILPLAFLAPLLSGLALIPAYPPLDQGYLGWMALIPLLWFCVKASPRQALWGGFIFALPLHLYLNLYLAGVLVEYLPAPLAYLAMSLLVLVLGSFYALFALAAAWFARSRVFSFGLVFILPALWLLIEYARSASFIGYNVGYLGYTQWGYPFILNLAAVYGYWGLPFMMIGCQSLLVLALSGRLKRQEQLGAAILIAALLLAGLILPSRFQETGTGEKLETALIQGNSAPEEILTAAGKEEILKRYLGMTRQAAAAEPQLQLVAWPETVVDLHMTKSDLHRPEMKALAEEFNLKILYGARLWDGSSLYNSVVLLSPGDDKAQLYHKQRLVPFVEYFPLPEQLNQILDLDQRMGCYTAGKESTIFQINHIPLAAVVCFESYFGSVTRHFSRDGARHLFVLTNDAWFGESIGLEQHVQAAAIRAAEMGIGVTQVANSGITASFDYRGREIFRSGKAEPDIFVVPLELSRRKTVYALAGDYFPAIWAAHLAVSAIYAALVIKRRNRRLVKSL